MIRTIKLKKKLLSKLSNEEEKKIVLLELYTLILGYFSRKKDRNMYFDDYELLEDIEFIIRKLLNTNYKILGVKNNCLDSFNLFINNYSNESNKKLSALLSDRFDFAYSYYDYYMNKYNSLFDYLIVHKHQNLENKLKKLVLN